MIFVTKLASVAAKLSPIAVRCLSQWIKNTKTKAKGHKFIVFDVSCCVTVEETAKAIRYSTPKLHLKLFSKDDVSFEINWKTNGNQLE